MVSHVKSCPVCGLSMVRYGRASNGVQRWLCRDCGLSARWRNDTQARDLAQFLDFILGKVTYRELPGQGPTFRRKSQSLWNIWPISIPSGETYRVIHVDGIYLRRVAVVLIAQSTSNEVIAWHVTRSEITRTYEAVAKRLYNKTLPQGYITQWHELCAADPYRIDC